MTKQFGMGWIKDPPDRRDYNIRQLIAPLKEALPLTFTVYEDTIIYDQGQTSKCVAHASSGVKTDEEFLQWGQRYKFDPDWLYAHCKKEDGIPNLDGTYPRVACKAMQEHGMKLADTQVSCCKVLIGEADKKWSIAAYYRIDATDTDDMIKQILYQYGSFLAASNWYSNWSGKFYTFTAPEGLPTGGHCYRIIGWNTIGWLVANSWGTLLWGNMGRAIMPYDIFRQYVLPEGDCWKIIDNK